MKQLRLAGALNYIAGLFAGISRHGVLAAERIASQPRARAGTRQAASLAMGSVLIGLGVAMFVQADLGVPAYDVMLTALRDRLGVSLGQAGWLFTGTLFAIAAALGQRPRFSGLLYMLMNGASVDLFSQLLGAPEALPVRLAFVVLGTLSIAGGLALVVHAGLTGGAIELLMNAGEARGFDPFRLRRWIEIGIVAAGLALGGDMGLATIFFVLTMSPILRASRVALEDHRAGRRVRLEHEQPQDLAASGRRRG